MAKEINLLNTYPVIKILGTIFLATSFIYLGLWFLVFKHNIYELTDGAMNPIAYLFHTSRQLFTYADDWNWLLLSLLFSLLIIIFSLLTFFTNYSLTNFIALISNRRRTFLFWLIRTGISLTLTFIVIIIIGYIINVASTSPKIYSFEEFKGQSFENKGIVILVLGTSKYLTGTKNLNTYYKNRISTTIKLANLYSNSIIFISGDKNPETNYDEPRDMRMDLLSAGIENKRLLIDTKGFRTFDSIGKLKKAFPGSMVVIVSQTFHLQRALYLSYANGISSVGVSADGELTIRMAKREFLAKVKVLLDIYLFNTQVNGKLDNKRRSIRLKNFADVTLLVSTLVMVAIAGRLSRFLLII